MISRREFLQVAAATAALAAGRLAARLRAAAAHAGRPAALRAGRQRHAGPSHRHPRAARCRCCFASRRSTSASARRAARCRTSPAATFSISTRSRPAAPQAYALTSEDFAALAKSYGRLGGLDRIATVREGDPRRAPGPHACSSTAATPGRTATRRCRPRARTWSTAWRCSSPTP